MINITVGQTLNIAVAVYDFCGTQSQLLYIDNVGLGVDAPASVTIDQYNDCLDLSNLGIEIKLADVAQCSQCTTDTVYQNLGTIYTNSQGVASMSHVITNTDLSYYEQAVAAGAALTILACITNPQGQPIGKLGACSDSIVVTSNLCAGVVCREGCIGNDLYDQTCNPATGSCEPNSTPKEVDSIKCTATHVLDIIVAPHSWYTPGDAASQIVNSLSDINGAIINGLTEIGFFNWTYLDTEIVTESNNVIIRVYLQEVTLSPLSFSPYTKLHISSNQEIRKLAIGPWTILAIGVAVVIIGIGMIVGYYVYRALELLTSETYTKKQVGDYTNDILERMMTNCDANFPDDPVGYANCVKSGIQSVTGAAQDFFNDQAIGGAGDTAAANIDVCVQDYNDPSSPKYQDSVALKECTNTQNKNTQQVITDHTQPEGSGFGSLLLLGLAGLAMLGMMKSGGGSVLRIQTERELTGKK